MDYQLAVRVSESKNWFVSTNRYQDSNLESIIFMINGLNTPLFESSAYTSRYNTDCNGSLVWMNSRQSVLGGLCATWPLFARILSTPF